MMYFQLGFGGREQKASDGFANRRHGVIEGRQIFSESVELTVFK